MSKKFIRADPLAWEQAFALLQDAQAECDNLEMPRDDAILDATWNGYYEREEELLALPAPNVEAVITKLMLIFADEIRSELPEGLQKCTVIGDIRRLKSQRLLR